MEFGGGAEIDEYLSSFVKVTQTHRVARVAQLTVIYFSVLLNSRSLLYPHRTLHSEDSSSLTPCAPSELCSSRWAETVFSVCRLHFIDSLTT